MSSGDLIIFVLNPTISGRLPSTSTAIYSSLS